MSEETVLNDYLASLKNLKVGEVDPIFGKDRHPWVSRVGFENKITRLYNPDWNPIHIAFNTLLPSMGIKRSVGSIKNAKELAEREVEERQGVCANIAGYQCRMAELAGKPSGLITMRGIDFENKAMAHALSYIENDEGKVDIFSNGQKLKTFNSRKDMIEQIKKSQNEGKSPFPGFSDNSSMKYGFISTNGIETRIQESSDKSVYNRVFTDKIQGTLAGRIQSISDSIKNMVGFDNM
jgi:hypothetical protein